MSREEITERVNAVFCDAFGRNDLTVSDPTTAADVDGWDSLRHISLLEMVEDEFDIRFSMGEVVNMANVGDMIDRIEEKL